MCGTRGKVGEKEEKTRSTKRVADLIRSGWRFIKIGCDKSLGSDVVACFRVESYSALHS